MNCRRILARGESFTHRRQSITRCAVLLGRRAFGFPLGDLRPQCSRDCTRDTVSHNNCLKPIGCQKGLISIATLCLRVLSWSPLQGPRWLRYAIVQHGPPICLAHGSHRGCPRGVAAIAALQFTRRTATTGKLSVALQLLLSTGLAGNGVLSRLSFRAWGDDSRNLSSFHVFNLPENSLIIVTQRKQRNSAFFA